MPQITADDYASYLSQITSACGLYVAGTYSSELASESTKYDAGYMRYSDGLDFCANADTAAADHC